MHRYLLGVQAVSFIALLACSERTLVEGVKPPLDGCDKPTKDDKSDAGGNHSTVDGAVLTSMPESTSGDSALENDAGEGALADAQTGAPASLEDAAVPDASWEDAQTAPLPGAVVFATDQVLEVQITMTEADRSDLEEHGNLELYLPAQVVINGQDLSPFSATQVGIRHKGAYSLHHCFDEYGVRNYAAECAKLSYKLKFDEFESNVTFDGLQRLNLHASSGDATMLRELLAYSTFRDFGVDAPRTTLVRLTINGVVAGLFIGVEELDGRYAAAHYPDGPDGNLFKEVWPVTGQPNQYFIDALETNEDGPEVSDMQAFSVAIGLTDTTTFDASMASWLDLDAIVRYLAVDRALKNWDGIMAFYAPITPHNFFWYHDSSLNPRFHLIPWDLDNTFGEYDPYMSPQDSGWISVPAVPDWNVTPANCEPRPVWDNYSNTYITPPRCDRFMDLLAQTQWTRFVELGNELLATQLSPSVIEAKLKHWQDMLQPLLLDDPYLKATDVTFAQENFRALVADLASDFGLHLSEGLLEEASEPEQELPDLREPPTLEELSEPKYAAPLEVESVTNFEYIDGVGGMEVPGSAVVYDYYSTASVSWNQQEPIADSADVRLDFNHVRADGPYNEWVNLVLQSNYEVDLRDYTQIEMTVRTDQERLVRVRIYGSAYDTEFGGVWSEFGEYFTVDTTPRTIVLTLRDLSYPEWARDEVWQPGQGWETTDDEARDRVFATFSSLIFVPGALVDGTGELIAPEDPGYLQVDNIYFR